MDIAYVKLGKYSHIVKFDKDEVIINKACDIQGNIVKLIANIPKSRILLTMDDDIITQFSFEFTAKGKWKPENKPMLEDAMAELNEAVEGADKVLNNPFWRDFAFFMQDSYDVFYPPQDNLVEVNIIEQLRKEKTNHILLNDFSAVLEDDLDIKLVVDKTNEKRTYYYLKDGFYEYLNATTLQEVIGQQYDLRLNINDVKYILTCFNKTSEVDNDHWEFANGYLNINTYEFEHLNEPRIVPRKMTFNGKKIPYDEDVKYPYVHPFLETDAGNPKEEQTFVEKTLRKILVPKYDKNDIYLLQDFLERFGACFQRNNEEKKITQYYGTGNDGKTTLTTIQRLVFGNWYHNIPAKKFKDDFVLAYVAGHHIIAVDEVLGNSFNHHFDILKLMSNGVNNSSARGHQDSKPTDDLEFGMLFIFSNVTPDLSTGDSAILTRWDILEVPNKFVKRVNNINEYKQDPKLYQKLANDFDGMAWLVNASIQAYKFVKTNEIAFRCAQTDVETATKYASQQSLQVYLKMMLEPAEDGKMTTDDIIKGYEAFCQERNIKSELDINYRKAQSQVGKIVTLIYGEDIKHRVSSNVIYKLAPKAM